jgi:Zinc carboxypeptidase
LRRTLQLIISDLTFLISNQKYKTSKAEVCDATMLPQALLLVTKKETKINPRIMKKICWMLLVSALCLGTVAQLKSPEQFLGYKLGERYSPHFKVVSYFQHVAQQSPDMVRLEQYGETNEGRPLLLAYIASKENFANLEKIRLNNLRLANAAADKAAPVEEAPAIVWLSYNVHGNETSSSEAAMLTLYELVNPNNARSGTSLKNTVVIIDPCINPDGRDRYVNWFNTVVGKKANAYPAAREHAEPWPRGRSNHYYFDLNRDWAWQTQTETQQRMVKYNQWLPQVHVDFHEQGYNEPYYFAPAAEPFHEVITQWQREFQTMIGKNHAKYFDANGWLYFTKERFDLFYPSYGDTYPTYNGAIGMTYEQGGIGSGRAVVTEDGDTLTLYDRLMHHFTTGISTVEITAQHAGKVVTEFRKYFNAAVQTPAGEFKSFVIKNDGTDRIERLKTLLDRNSIDWYYAPAASLNGLNYFTGKAEAFKTVMADVVINMNQPKSNFIKVLFERTSKLSDSATYDITAWSVPFAYGLNAYGVSNYINGGSKTAPPVATTLQAPLPFNATFAYAIKWNGMSSAKLLAALLQKGVKVRYAEQAFKVAGTEFDKGTLLVTKAANYGLDSQLETIVKTAAFDAGTAAVAVPSGFVEKGFDIGSDRVRTIQTPKVALIAGNNVSSLGFGEIWHFFEQQLNYPLTIINADDLARINLGDFNVLIFPDSYTDLLTDKNKSEELKSWVRKGGKIITIESAVTQLSRGDWGLKLKSSGDEKTDKKDDYSLIRKYENRERDWLVNSTPGSIYKLELDNSHPLAFGYSTDYFTLKQDDNVYEFMSGGWNVGVIKKDNYISGFTGSKAKERIKDGTLIGAMEMGRGTVVFFADNPMFRSFWENGKLMFCNAVFLAGQ